MSRRIEVGAEVLKGVLLLALLLWLCGGLMYFVFGGPLLLVGRVMFIAGLAGIALSIILIGLATLFAILAAPFVAGWAIWRQRSRRVP